MIDEKRYIQALQVFRIKRADAAMQSGASPIDATYCYGREVGINAGLRMAEELLLDLIKDDKGKDE